MTKGIGHRRSGVLVGTVLLLAACSSSQMETGTTEPTAKPATDRSATPTASVYQLPPGAPPLPPDLLAIGSQEARDDLYCSAMIYNANPDVSDALAPVDEALLRKAQMMGFIIGEAGINRLVEERAAHATHARAIAEAYAAKVEKDLESGNPRIALETCVARAQAVPVPE